MALTQAIGSFVAGISFERLPEEAVEGEITTYCGCRFVDASGDNHRPEDRPSTSHKAAIVPPSAAEIEDANAHLFKGGQEDPRIARLQAMCDANIAEYGLVDATGKDG